MLFHTWIFAVFLLIVWPAYMALRRTRFRTPLLLVASYVFYGWWNCLYLLLIAWSTLIDWTMVVLMGRFRRPWARRLFLFGSVANNVALLSQFKYASFLIDSLNALLGWAGSAWMLRAPGVVWPPGITHVAEQLSALLTPLTAWLGIPGPPATLSLLLPVGISFYTFQSMSYTIDFFRGRVEKEPSLLRFATFVSLFPQLVAGPIERARNLLPQLRTPPPVRLADVTDGLSMFVVGLFKKVAIADYLAMYVDEVYKLPGDQGAPALLLATVAFSWQIYFDFSGYTDMARGAARMMGFRLMLNFNSPYLADSLGDFWSRWHISLSTWFRDYFYVPLGGNRKGKARTYVNMVLTMLISGLWHGAAWTFVAWGAFHAAGRAMTRGLEATDFYRRRIPRILKQLLVFAFVTFAWIFFRAGSIEDAWAVISGIFTGPWIDPRCPVWAMALIVAVWAYQFAFESRLRPLLRLAPVRVGLVILMILYLAILPGGQDQPFIYFQF